MSSLKTPLVLVTALSVALLMTVLVQRLTASRIEVTEQAQFHNLMDELLHPTSGSAIEYDNDPQDDVLAVSSTLLNLNGATRIYRFRKNGEPVAAVIESVAPDGYNGDIELMIAISLTGELLGVRTLGHQETPGLGDDINIQRSNWITQFDNLSLRNMPDSDWQVIKDGGQFDQFTGATITPRAVVRSVHHTLLWYAQNQDQLYSLPSQSLLE